MNKNLLRFSYGAVIASILVSLIAVPLVTGNCPNYGTQSGRCPDAPADYDYGNCGISFSLNPATGFFEPQATGGRCGAYNLNKLQSNVSGSQITGNESVSCYTLTTCSGTSFPRGNMTDSQLNGIYGSGNWHYYVTNSGNYVVISIKNIDTFNSMSYSAGPCPG